MAKLTEKISKLNTELLTSSTPSSSSFVKSVEKFEIAKSIEPVATTTAVADKPQRAQDLPSVEKEKSVAPSVTTIKEEEWPPAADDETETEEAENETDENVEADEAAAAAKQAKKSIVIREYKAKKEPVNVIFCGHVDAGKSTIGGQIMFLTGMVDRRTLEKYEREAKEKNRETWYLSWALDTNIGKLNVLNKKILDELK